jgi:hypothetical protein
MVVYDYLKKYEDSEQFLFLLKKGVVSLKILNYKCYYEKFLQFQSRGFGKLDSYSMTAEEYKVSENTVRNAVNFMVK